MEKTLESKFLYKNDFLFISNSKEKFEEASEVAKNIPTQKIITTEELANKYTSFPILSKDFQVIQDTSSGILTAGKII